MVAPIRATLPAVHSVMQKQRASLASPVLSTVEMDYETDGAADDGFRCFEDSACSFGQQSNKAEPSVRLKGRLIDESLCQAAQDKPTTYLKTQRVLPRHAPTTFSASRMSVTSPLLDSTDPTDYVTSDANALHPLQRSCSQPSSSGTYSAPGKRHSSQRSALYSDCHSRSRDEATTGSSSFEQNCNCGSINVSTVHDEETSCMRAQLQDGTRYFPSSPIMSSPTFAQEWARSLHRIRRTLCAAPGDWTDPRTGRWATPSHLKAYVPLLVWLFVSVTMAVVVGVWHVQVFSALDALATYLKSKGLFGAAILFSCIFATCFPPLPLYSTFIILSGYSFGLLQGFLISYTAALSGAVVVYLLSRAWLKPHMERTLAQSQNFCRIVRAIERRPRLLYLIRLSPYPYNLMNTLLASSETLSFRCYFWCTALSLPKLVVHCSIGTTIRSFAAPPPITDENGSIIADPEQLQRELAGQRLKTNAGAIGLALCVAVFLYILYVVRRAIDEENADGCQAVPVTSSIGAVPHGYDLLSSGLPRYRKPRLHSSSVESIEVSALDLSSSSMLFEDSGHGIHIESETDVPDKDAGYATGGHRRRHSYDEVQYQRHPHPMRQIGSNGPLSATLASGHDRLSAHTAGGSSRPQFRQPFERQDSNYAAWKQRQVNQDDTTARALHSGEKSRPFSWFASGTSPQQTLDSDRHGMTNLPYSGRHKARAGSQIPLLADVGDDGDAY